MKAGELYIELSANMARLSNDLNRAKQSVDGAMRNIDDRVKQTAQSMLGLLSIGAVFASYKAAIDAADNLNDLSKSTGVAIEDLAGLKMASEQSGASLEGTAQAINKLSLNIGKNADAYRKIGITTKDPLEAFKQLADIFVSIKDPQLRAAVAAEALGKSWAGAAPLLSEGSKGIERMIEKGTDLSGVTTALGLGADEFNDRVVELKTALVGITNAGLIPILPLMTQLAEDLTDVAREARQSDAAFNPMAETLRAVMILGGNVGFVLKAIGTEIGIIAAQGAAIARGDFKQALEIHRMAVADAEKARTAFDAWEQKILTLGKTTVKAADEASGSTKKLTAAQLAALKAFADAQAAQKQQAAESYIANLSKEYGNLAGTMTKVDEVQEHLRINTDKFTPAQKATALAIAAEIDASKRASEAANERARVLGIELDAQEKATDAHYAAIEALERVARDQEFELTLLGKSAEAIEAARFAREQDVLVRAAEAALVTRGMQEGWDEIRMMDERAKMLRAISDAQKAFNARQADALDQQRNQSRGVTEAIKEYHDELAKGGEAAKNAATRSLHGIEDAMVDMMMTGKLNTKSLVDMMLSEFYRLQVVRPLMAQLLGTGGAQSGLMSLFGSAGSIGGLLSTIKYSGTSTAVTAANYENSFDMMATPLASGMPYVPYDNFPAMLHKGERVLTAAENAQGGGSVVNNYTFHGGVSRGEVMAGLSAVRGMARSDRVEDQRRGRP